MASSSPILKVKLSVIVPEAERETLDLASAIFGVAFFSKVKIFDSTGSSAGISTGFSETATKNGGQIKYQISNDSGTTWYWYNPGWTTTSSGYTEANTASDINSNISTFPVGSGSFLFKAYLNSDGTQLVQLDSVNLTYINDITGPTVSAVSSTPTSAGATITWTTNEDSSSKVDYGLTNSYGSTTTETDTTTRVQTHSVTLSGLSSCTTYHYRARSIDAALN